MSSKEKDFFKRIKNLSEQQKEILVNVCDRWINTKEMTNTTELYWEIARKFNKDGNRIDPKKPYLLTNNHYASVGRSLKKLRERDLVHPIDLFGKENVVISEDGKKWCEITVDGFKEKWDKSKKDFDKKKLLQTEKIKTE